MSSGDIIGSWFPTGFYGHFRSKSRNDYNCQFRRLATPQPPPKFNKRAKAAPKKHVFSHHDNRQSFMTDALIFEEGLGRRRCQTAMFKSKPDFMHWSHDKTSDQWGRTTYRDNFHASLKVPRLLYSNYHPTQSSCNNESDMITTYRYAYGSIPHHTTLRRCSTSQNHIRSMSTVPPGRNDVASCLVWYTGGNGQTAVKGRVPQATVATDYTIIDLNKNSNNNSGRSCLPVVQVTAQ